jgi:transposase-like protein
MKHDKTSADETAARAYFEGIRWPSGPFCPHCGEAKRVYRLEGKSHRPGLFHCNSCAGQFTVTTGSVMESSHIPLSKWLMGFKLYAASKKGFSAHQLHRMIGVTYKSAWFMAHRIREAMADTDPSPMGSGGGTVEADETFIGRRKGTILQKGHGHKMAVMSLVERKGKSRSFPVANEYSSTVLPILKANVSKSATVMTDSSLSYGSLPLHFARHEAVNHKNEEWVRGDAHTNTIEGFFSVFKRGMKGVYQHCSECIDKLVRRGSERDFESGRAKLRFLLDLLHIGE